MLCRNDAPRNFGTELAVFATEESKSLWMLELRSFSARGVLLSHPASSHAMPRRQAGKCSDPILTVHVSYAGQLQSAIQLRYPIQTQPFAGFASETYYWLKRLQEEPPLIGRWAATCLRLSHPAQRAQNNLEPASKDLPSPNPGVYSHSMHMLVCLRC